MSSHTLITIVIVAILALGAYALFGMGRTGPEPAGGSEEHQSSELGIAFAYPDELYEVTRQEGQENGGWQALVLMPKGFVPPAASEGPPTITILKFANPDDTPLETWVKTDQRSNYQLLTGATFASTTVAGEPAFSYQHGGLYETDAVAVAHGGSIYLFSAGWMTPNDRIRTDLQDLVKTVEFTN